MLPANMEHFMMKLILSKNVNVKMKIVIHVLMLKEPNIYALHVINHFIL